MLLWHCDFLLLLLLLLLLQAFFDKFLQPQECSHLDVRLGHGKKERKRKSVRKP